MWYAFDAEILRFIYGLNRDIHFTLQSFYLTFRDVLGGIDLMNFCISLSNRKIFCNIFLSTVGVDGL